MVFHYILQREFLRICFAGSFHIINLMGFRIFEEVLILVSKYMKTIFNAIFEKKIS